MEDDSTRRSMVAELIREAGFTAFAWAAGMEMLLDRLCRRMEDAR